MRLAILAATVLTLLVAPLVRAGEDTALAEILKKLTEIEERLERLEKKIDMLGTPAKVGPLEPERRTPIRVAVVLDLESLRAQPRHAGGSGHSPTMDLAVDARVKLWRAPGPVRHLMLSLHRPGPASYSPPWIGQFYGGDDTEWQVGEERTLNFTMWEMFAYRGHSFRSVFEALARPRLHLYVDSFTLTDGTVWGDTRSYWAQRIERLEEGMSFAQVKELLPPHDDDIGTQAFPGKPVFRTWLLSPRWRVELHFGKEGLTGEPRLLPVGAHTDIR